VAELVERLKREYREAVAGEQALAAE